MEVTWENRCKIRSSWILEYRCDAIWVAIVYTVFGGTINRGIGERISYDARERERVL